MSVFVVDLDVLDPHFRDALFDSEFLDDPSGERFVCRARANCNLFEDHALDLLGVSLCAQHLSLLCLCVTLSSLHPL